MEENDAELLRQSIAMAAVECTDIETLDLAYRILLSGKIR